MLYHGSTKKIGVGEILLPGSEIGQGDMHEYVYATNDIGLASQYALPKGYVYGIEPISIVDNDVFGYGPGTIVECESAKILAIIEDA